MNNTVYKLNKSVTCPHCQQVFKLDETGYADIVKQVRDEIFEQEIEQRLLLAEKEKQDAIKLAEANIINDFKDKITQKELEITQFKNQIQQTEMQKVLAISNAVKNLEKERDELKYTLEKKDLESTNAENSLKQQHAIELKIRDEEVARLKDMKAKLSTKMVGETLEQHCEIQFKQLQPTAFQNATFGKDNKAIDGTKGDYIYRETDSEGNELISIMFEMKNENDETATKKKNEDFFKKLNGDRVKKNCEYAVLVSLLEADNDLYNGITDVSYHYKKMYVIRPQFFIPMITLLRNAAFNSLQYKQELAMMKNQQIDITNFENKINDFREKFTKNYLSASNSFQKAIKEIDASIAKMEAVKKALTTTENQLRLANNKAQQDLTIRKLTYNNPTMKQKFKELE